jgi:hypothetical protein
MSIEHEVIKDSNFSWKNANYEKTLENNVIGYIIFLISLIIMTKNAFVTKRIVQYRSITYTSWYSLWLI